MAVHRQLSPLTLLTVLTALLAAGSARADTRHFTYSYEPNNVLPKGALEFEQWATLRAGKEEGVFSRWDLREEFEYGITDRLTSSLYLNFTSTHVDLAGEDDDEDEFEFGGISSEWKYKISDPTADPIGFLLYGEFTTNLQEIELEEKLVLGKVFDRLVLAFNGIFEQEWEFEKEDTEDLEVEKELKIEVTAGAAYRITDRFALGIEVREVNVFPEMEDLEHAALFAGPTIHYEAERWWASFTVLPQIVAFKGTTGSSVNLDEFERAEFRLIFGIHI